MIGQTVSHYKIVRQLGAGGMGVVFAAHDPRLGREVALKFVPEELGHDPHALERLRSEARTASSLSHPNICTIYDIGEYEGRPYIVMELLHGQTLRERMTSRPMKVHETLDIGIQVADALYWAHSRDVIHRDIKPANLFLVESGQLKVLDFGLAKLVPNKLSTEMTVAPTIDLTAVGVALGTVAYMSPEQVTGETLDRRTDLFSLGVVLYECATGQQPFKGKTSAVVLASILTQTPVPPVSLNQEIPIRLQEIINNCLEKDRELRYQDAAALRTDLRRLKRDLESGASGTVRTTSATILATGAVAPPTPSGSAAAIQKPSSDSQATNAIAAPVPASGGVATVAKRPMIGIAAAAAIVIVAAGGFLLMRKPLTPPTVPATEVAQSTPPVTTTSPSPAETPGRRLAEQAAASLLAGNYRAALSLSEDALKADAGNSEAARVRSEAAAAIARFDEAIVSANRALAAGDADTATRALNSARAVDPASPVVAALSARILEQVSAQSESARKSADAAARSAAQSSANAAPARRPAPEPSRPPVPPPSVSPPAQSAAASTPPQTQTQPAPQPTPSTGQVASPTPPAPQTPPQEPLRTPPPARADTAPSRPTTPTPGPTVEDDDAAIRRVVASYARAIETKDIALFKTVKPNLSPMEQRRIEEGFRGIDQRVNVTILSIEHRGADAIVRAHRHDVITARGRVQTSDAEQTLTMTKSAQGWIIREIGR